jgi:uncharacterized protein YqjF (DUF2071 family)
MIDRLSIRTRPAGWPMMYQSWGKLLFLHWPVSEEVLRPLIPGRLHIDTFESQAWIGIVPFTMWGIRPPFFPPLPLASQCHELNVRTYVHLDGVPGVWFCSLDASSRLVVWGARTAFSLPYYHAQMGLEQNGEVIHYHSRRRHASTPPAEFEATWTSGEVLPEAQPGSLEYFLVERYCLYTERQGRLYRARIHHPPWQLCRASLSSLASTMVEAQGLPTPSGTPLLHAQGRPQHAKVWPLKPV